MKVDNLTSLRAHPRRMASLVQATTQLTLLFILTFFYNVQSSNALPDIIKIGKVNPQNWLRYTYYSWVDYLRVDWVLSTVGQYVSLLSPKERCGNYVEKMDDGRRKSGVIHMAHSKRFPTFYISKRNVPWDLSHDAVSADIKEIWCIWINVCVEVPNCVCNTTKLPCYNWQM